MDPIPDNPAAHSTLLEGPLTPAMRVVLLAGAAATRRVCFIGAAACVLAGWALPALADVRALAAVLVVGLLGTTIAVALVWTGIWIVRDAARDAASSTYQQLTGPISTEMRRRADYEGRFTYDYFLTVANQCLGISQPAFDHVRLLTFGTVVCMLHRQLVFEVRDENGLVVYRDPRYAPPSATA